MKSINFNAMFQRNLLAVASWNTCPMFGLCNAKKISNVTEVKGPAGTKAVENNQGLNSTK